MSEISNNNCIGFYLHCGLCIKEDLPQRIEAGWTKMGLQIWCRNHDCNIMHINFEGRKHPANTTRQPTVAEKETRH